MTVIHTFLADMLLFLKQQIVYKKWLMLEEEDFIGTGQMVSRVK